MKEHERNTAYDYLRVLASFGVIILHIAAKKFLSLSVYSNEWQVLNFYDSIVRWTVPVFVMISGALFLNRDIPIRKLYLRYIPRLAVAFVVWSFAYAISTGYDFKAHKVMWLSGHYHMWYIPMCIGLYAALPIVKQIVSNKRIAYYYLLLSFVFAFIIPSAMALAKDFGPQWMNSLVRVANDVITDMHMQLVLGYSAYFVLGYVLSKPDSVKGKSIDRCIYVLGILGFLLTILVTLFASHRKAEAVTTYYDFLTVNVLLESVAVFTAFRRMDFKNERLNRVMARLAKYSFGAYLVHPMIIEKLASELQITSLSFYPGLSVPVLGCLVFVISYAVSFLLSQIPILNRYVV